MSKTEIYNYIIIGTGIAGLYSAYQIKKHNSGARILLLEKNKKADIGGRIGIDNFYGVEIAKGAGIGRIIDEILIELLREFGIPINKSISTIEYSPLFYENSKTDQKTDPKKELKELIKFLRKEFKKEIIDRKGTGTTKKTFREFAIPLLGKPKYDDFLEKIGYRDFENTDIEEALYYYGFEDCICCNEIIHLNWNKLLETFIEKIGIENFRFSQKVEYIHPIIEKPKEKTYEVKSQSNNYFGKNIIVATTIQTLRRLFPENPIYREIEGQSYLRVYGKFSKKSLEVLQKTVKSYTVLPGIIQKIIPINPEKGVYMICYNDNENAKSLKKQNKTENTQENREYYSRHLEKAIHLPKNSLELIAIKSYFWEIGTHYYKPLDRTKYKSRTQFIKEAQHPAPNILVVGEAVSRNQGWTEGALESVKPLNLILD